MLRFPLERRLAAIQAESEAQKLSEHPTPAWAQAGRSGGDTNFEYVHDVGFFGVRLRPQ